VKPGAEDPCRAPLTRQRLLRVAASGALALWAARLPGGVAWAAERAPRLDELAVFNGADPYAGDHNLLTTLSTGEAADRRAAYVAFRLDRVAKVTLDVIKTRRKSQEIVWTQEARLLPGPHWLAWKPDPGMQARTYLLRLTVMDKRGRRRVYGPNRPYLWWLPRSPVVRLLGMEASFANRSYVPGQRAELRVTADTAAVTVEIFRCGLESEATYRNDEMKGVSITEPVTLDWRASRNGPRPIHVRLGNWPSGLYFARLTAEDGPIGFAPFVIRPSTLGEKRVAVVLPTNTWQAYNFADTDGDGWGDTWYAGGSPPLRLDRCHLNRGVPYRFRSYDHAFLRWLHHTGKEADFLAEDDLEGVRSGDELAAAYDLVVFPGHTEYVSEHEYDVIERYRDLGGNLMFLSANNFFWKVERQPERLIRKGLWRDLGRPEARLIGVQYLANDDGTRQGPFVVTGADALPWAFEGTGLRNGDAFGIYGIEIDATTPATPPGTHVLATIPDLFGPGKSAQMTYYETAAGARVFAAGALNFGGSVGLGGGTPDPRITRLLENLWARLSAP
jgi:hypothetical protein